MQYNQKDNDKKFDVFGDTLHLYDNLVPVEIESEIGKRTEYKGELYTIGTDLQESVIEANFNVLLDMLKKVREQEKTCEHTKDLAEAYLEATDYLARKCYEKSVSMVEAYPTEVFLSEKARNVVRNGW